MPPAPASRPEGPASPAARRAPRKPAPILFGGFSGLGRALIFGCERRIVLTKAGTEPITGFQSTPRDPIFRDPVVFVRDEELVDRRIVPNCWVCTPKVPIDGASKWTAFSRDEELVALGSPLEGPGTLQVRVDSNSSLFTTSSPIALFRNHPSSHGFGPVEEKDPGRKWARYRWNCLLKTQFQVKTSNACFVDLALNSWCSKQLQPLGSWKRVWVCVCVCVCVSK